VITPVLCIEARISPGMTETPIWDDLPRQKRREMFENTATQLPARKIGQPDDIAKAVLFLIQKGSRLAASFKSVEIPEVPIVKGRANYRSFPRYRSTRTREYYQ
jgi:NAD(P)-dependent dehydrogenase (short-subunit alcohol dehydrogenase family)